MPRMTPRREERSPITSPIFSSAVSTSTAMIGSSSTGLAARMPSLKAKIAAILNAFSFQSTSWYEPSVRLTLLSPTLDRVDEFIALAVLRLELQPDVAILTAATRLLDELALGFERLLEGLA